MMVYVGFPNLVFIASVLSISVIISGQSIENANSNGCKIADLAFLIDSSRSLGSKAFQKELSFVDEVLEYFDIGQYKTRVAVQTFSAGTKIEFYFNQHYNKNDIRQAIRNISYADGMCTLIYRGLEQARNEMFLEVHGARPEIQNVAIVLTDGETNPGRMDQISLPAAKSLTRKEANHLKLTGVDIYSVGVGPRVDDDEMIGIASGRSNYYKVDSVSDFENTEMIQRMLLDVCTKEPRYSCFNKPADIFFIIDKSSSLSSVENFFKELSFVARFVEGFNIGQGINQSRVGVISFSTDTRLEFGLDAYLDKIAVQDALLDIEFSTGNTFTHKALQMMLLDGFGFNGRQGVPHIGIIMTDGQSTDPYQLADVLQDVQQAQIEMFAVGFANASLSELKLMASDPDIDHVHIVDNLYSLDTVRDELYIHICNYIGQYSIKK